MDAFADISRQADALRYFFNTGATLNYEFRLAALNRLFVCIKRREADIAAALHADLGKAPGEAYLTETGMILGELAFLRRKLRALMKPRRAQCELSFFPAKGRVYPEPFGVCLIMAPWNYPLNLSLIPLADAVAAGNCVMLKPSSRAPATAAMLEEIIAECFDFGHVCLALGKGEETGAALLAGKWDFIFYTGSARVGREVMTAAARHLTPICLELGGKSPVIVAADADIALTARRIAWGKMLNAGQTCVAPDYILVAGEVKDKLVAALAAELAAFPGEGKAALYNPDYCRIVSKQALERLETLTQGRAVFDYDRLRMAPLLLPDAAPDDPAMREEIFGPILPILTVKDVDEAVDFVRAREKPLACYIFTASKATAADLLSRISSGGACVNDTIMQTASPHLPFGGVGASGMGRYHGRTGFELFSNMKSVVFRGTCCDPRLRYLPVGARALVWLRRLLG